MALEQPSEDSGESQSQAARNFFMMMESTWSAPLMGGPLAGALGSALFQPGDNWQEVTGPDGQKHWQRVATPSNDDPQAQKIFNLVTDYSNKVGVPRKDVFQSLFAQKNDKPLFNDDSLRENIVKDIDFLDSYDAGKALIVANPQLVELKQELAKVSGKNPDQFREALVKDPDLEHLRQLLTDPQLHTLLEITDMRRAYQERYGHAPLEDLNANQLKKILKDDYGYSFPDGAKPTTEDMKKLLADRFGYNPAAQLQNINTQRWMDRVYTKDIADLIRAQDNPENVSPFFTDEVIAVNPVLASNKEALQTFIKKEFLDKKQPPPSAHDLVELARLKSNADISNFLQTAPTNQPVAANFNEVDRSVVSGVTVGNVKAAIFGNESASYHKPYEVMGPVIKGDRAYGKYQVMGNNIASWTQEALGKPMTREEFIHSPEAQEMVASYMMKKEIELSNQNHSGHASPEQIIKDVASKWHSGRPFDQVVGRPEINDRHWTTEHYADVAWASYSKSAASGQPVLATLPTIQPIAGTDATNAIGFALGDFADAHRNTRYAKGGGSLESGIDCSHFAKKNTLQRMQQVNERAGVEIYNLKLMSAYLSNASTTGRMSGGQYEALRRAGYTEYSRADIDAGRLAPGSLIFVNHGGAMGIEHVAQVSLDHEGKLQISQSGGSTNRTVNNESYAYWMNRHAGARLTAINPFEVKDPALLAKRDEAFKTVGSPTTTASAPHPGALVMQRADLSNLLSPTVEGLAPAQPAPHSGPADYTIYIGDSLMEQIGMNAVAADKQRMAAINTEIKAAEKNHDPNVPDAPHPRAENIARASTGFRDENYNYNGRNQLTAIPDAAARAIAMAKEGKHVTMAVLIGRNDAQIVVNKQTGAIDPHYEQTVKQIAATFNEAAQAGVEIRWIKPPLEPGKGDPHTAGTVNWQLAKLGDFYQQALGPRVNSINLGGEQYARRDGIHFQASVVNTVAADAGVAPNLAADSPRVAAVRPTQPAQSVQATPSPAATAPATTVAAAAPPAMTAAGETQMAPKASAVTDQTAFTLGQLKTLLSNVAHDAATIAVDTAMAARDEKEKQEKEEKEKQQAQADGQKPDEKKSSAKQLVDGKPKDTKTAVNDDHDKKPAQVAANGRGDLHGLKVRGAEVATAAVEAAHHPTGAKQGPAGPGSNIG